MAGNGLLLRHQQVRHQPGMSAEVNSARPLPLFTMRSIHGFLHVARGRIVVTGQALEAGDAAKLEPPTPGADAGRRR
ncbi:hypothetical protein AWV80_30115 [Cupriavidus sp. UYMU48A]|nr:hypothetical protein AWV80_30115 [Cupriavidus sp. UYMU48A]